MIMEKSVKQQSCSKLCSSLVTFLPIILVLVLFSLFFFFPISEPSPFLLTIPIVLLSTMFLVKKKGSPNKNLVQDMLQKEEFQPSLGEFIQTEEAIRPSEAAQKHEQKDKVQSDSSFPSNRESSNGSVMGEKFDLSAQKHEEEANPQSDSSLPSDSESSTGSIMGKSFELDHNKDQNLGISDSLASENDDDDDDEKEEEEEDSLIEINLLSSDFSGFSEEPKQKMESKFPDFLPESIFKQQGLMELLAEINEDENLIEIDISRGSTKCQDLRLKQELAFLGEQCILSD